MAYVKAAGPGYSAALEPPLPSWAAEQCVAQGNRCPGPENYHPAPPSIPREQRAPSSLILLSEMACCLGGPRARGQRQGKNETQAGGGGGVLSCPGLRISLLTGTHHWGGQVGITRNKGRCAGQPAGVKWPRCNAGWVCSPGYTPVSAQLGHQSMVPVLFHGCHLQDQVTLTENINTNT